MATIESTEVSIPTAVTALNLLGRVDYEDAYSVATTSARNAEGWARAFGDDAPAWFRVPWLGIGKVAMGADVGPLDHPDYVVGWKVLHNEPDLFVIGMDSTGGLIARLFFVTSPGEATMATQIRLDSVYSRAAWPAIRTGHRYFAPYLLRRAAATQ